jgi:hypothetical protein
MGFGTADLKRTKLTGTAARRFVKSDRNALWQADYPDFIVIPTFRWEM